MKQAGRNVLGPEHPAPPHLSVPGFADRLRGHSRGDGFGEQPVGQLCGQDTQHDGQLVHRNEAAPESGGRDLRNIHRREVRGDADGEPAEYTIDDKHRKAARRTRPDGRGDEQRGRNDQHFLAPVTVAERSGQQGSGQTADESAAHGPPLQGGAVDDAEEWLIKRFGTSDYDPVVTEQQSAHGRDQRYENQIGIVEFFHMQFSDW